MLIDTHCHIHETEYPLDVSEVLRHAQDAGVAKMICVGTGEQSSLEATQFAEMHDHIYASIGVHPHEAKDGYGKLAEMNSTKVIAVGEIGLDYFYTHSSRDVQIAALKDQIELAIDRDLPIIFHVRDAFDDFWPIYDSYSSKIRGVLHSFTDSRDNMTAAVARGLYIGVNGISTFTKDKKQQEMFAAIPTGHLLLETDAPFLTPTPLRGTVNEPAFVRYVAEHHAKIRGLSLEEIATQTSTNAHALFAL
jgi:TatD DNase family protein